MINTSVARVYLTKHHIILHNLHLNAADFHSGLVCYIKDIFNGGQEVETDIKSLHNKPSAKRREVWCLSRQKRASKTTKICSKWGTIAQISISTHSELWVNIKQFLLILGLNEELAGNRSSSMIKCYSQSCREFTRSVFFFFFRSGNM